MSLYRELSYQSNITPVRSVQFSLLSPEEIRQRSVVEIRSTESFNGSVQIPNGLFDQRMGVVEHGKFCQTCHQGYTFCPGHIGHIELACPVFHVHFFKTVVNVLKCVCWRCSKLLLHPESPEMVGMRRFHRQKRWEAVYHLISKTGSLKRCSREDGCGALQPSRLSKHDEKFMKCEMSWELAAADEKDKPAKLTLGAEEVLAILRRIPDADVTAMGFHAKYSRPEWMIATVLLVPPPAVRPSAKNDMGQRSEDDLTTVLCNIVKTNNALLQKKTAGKTAEGGEQQQQLLQYYVATMVDNTIPNMSPATQRTGRSIKSISERLKGKEGRVRGNLLGKRVDYSARSVITPDPNISVNELGVPMRIAMNLTFPETVTQRSRAKLQAAVDNGPHVFPGARFVQKQSEDMRTIQLREGRSPPELEEGDVVHRHMRDGDYVLFNRQPSLHKMSMMAHKVRVMEYHTFRLNAMVTPQYNADFDGDEMNLHLPITPFSMTEIALLAAVPMHVLSPKDSSPIMAVVQDVALGVHLVTLPDVRIGKRDMFNLMCSIPRFDGRVPDPAHAAESWSGKQALSAVIPASVNAALKGTLGVCHVKHGDMSELGGAIAKSAFQKNTEGLVHSVLNDLGPRALTDMMDGAQRLVCDWLLQVGFSVGLSDLYVDEKTLKEIQGKLIDAERSVEELVSTIHSNKWRPKASLNAPCEDFENEVNKLLNASTDEVGKVIKSRIDPGNRIMRMITAGSKGKLLNITQMTATLGQQTVDQKRPGYGFDGRTLPHYPKYDDGPEARGFVRSSFARGLKPSEFLFHSMGGRVGLIDTAVRTSESGYISRKLVKAMEDCKVAADGTVRNALGQVVQLLYGEDGMDTVSIERQEVFDLDYDGERMADEFLVLDEPLMEALLAPDAYESWKADPQLERFEAHFRATMEDRIDIVMYMHGGRVDVKQQKHVDFPVNIGRIVSNAVELQRKTVPPGWPSDLDPRGVLDEIDAMVRDLTPHRAVPQCMVFSVLIRAHLSPKRLLKEGVLRSTFASIAADIRDRFEDALAQPGDMVGIVSAQSLGEPTTQLTLNTFHLAGVASGSKAVSGLPRVMELLNVTANPKQSLIYVHLPEDLRYSSEAATRMKSRLETTMLSQVVSRSRIYYDPDDTRVEEDKSIVEIYRALFPKGADAAPGAPWVIRLELDRAQMLEHSVTMLDVSDAINGFYRETVSTMHSDDNSDTLVFRIRLYPQGTDDDLLTEVRAFEAAMMENVTLKGNVGIRTAMPMQPPAVKRHEFDGASGKFVPVSDVGEWILETDGRDLGEVLSSPLVDARNTESNDICETLRVLGVEAARQKLYEELQEVLKDSDINPRHVLLLADTMTLGGGLQSINRHGINRGEIGPLAKCSFEETTDMLTNAAMFADVDRVNGVSASIMLGQVPPGGTGGVHPVLDESLLPDQVLVDHPKPVDDEHRVSDREDMCRRILRFAPIDMNADDGWDSPVKPKITIV